MPPPASTKREQSSSRADTGMTAQTLNCWHPRTSHRCRHNAVPPTPVRGLAESPELLEGPASRPLHTAVVSTTTSRLSALWRRSAARHADRRRYCAVRARHVRDVLVVLSLLGAIAAGVGWELQHRVIDPDVGRNAESGDLAAPARLEQRRTFPCYGSCGRYGVGSHSWGAAR